jgi:hypothetical protein
MWSAASSRRFRKAATWRGSLRDCKLSATSRRVAKRRRVGALHILAFLKIATWHGLAENPPSRVFAATSCRLEARVDVERGEFSPLSQAATWRGSLRDRKLSATSRRVGKRRRVGALHILAFLKIATWHGLRILDNDPKPSSELLAYFSIVRCADSLARPRPQFATAHRIQPTVSSRGSAAALNGKPPAFRRYLSTNSGYASRGAAPLGILG